MHKTCEEKTRRKGKIGEDIGAVGPEDATKTIAQQANAGRVRPKLLYTKVGIINAFQPSRTRPTGNNYTIL
jgi:hypothetical protein